MNCNYPQHDLCKNKSNCLIQHGNKYTTKLSREISYYLTVLDGLYHDRQLYFNTLHDINSGAYTTIHGQYTGIPKVNVLNTPITKPSDVYHNLDLKLIENNITITKNTIKELRLEENKVLKTIKRKKRRKKQYGI
jgi:hypothetical protein